jgi:RHS repeat-associated protein
VRQQFTGQERDDTGLDFFQARYFTSAQGRFASVDPANAGASLGDPQSWNGYAYVSNSPLRFTDPSGLDNGGGIPIIGAIIDFFSTLFGGGSSAPPTRPGPSTGSLDAQNPLLQGFNPCGGPSGTFGGGATGCPFVFSATNNGGSPVWVSGDPDPADLDSVLSGLMAIYRWLNPPAKDVIIHINGKAVNLGPMNQGVIPVGPPGELRLMQFGNTRKLSNILNDLFRAKGTIGSGSTADAIRYELQTGLKVGGKTHFTKGVGYRDALIKLLHDPSMSPSQLATIKAILTDLQNALSGQ